MYIIVSLFRGTIMFLHYIIYILLILNLLSFAIGYIIGKIWSTNGVYQDKPKSFLKKETGDSQDDNGSQSINSAKYVVGIKTEGLEKKYSNLGEVTQSDTNINNAVNKLKNMKG